MSTRAKIASALASVGVLVVGWQVGTASGQTVTSTPTTSMSSTTTSGSATTSVTSTSGASTSSAASTTASTNATTSALKNGTYTGTTATDRYGSVQVTITVAGGKITSVDATASANDGHSATINSRAIPVLKSETLSAQGANISTVSGATYTSDAYLTSLQSALDQANA